MRLLASVLCLVAVLGLPRTAHASDTANSTVVVTAQFSTRTSLKVSTELLRFDVADPAQAGTAVVDFSAAARTPSGADVVLSVEPLRGIEGPGGAADVDAALSFSGEGAGTLAGAIDVSRPSVAGRWSGSGMRTGRLVFALHATAAGSYTLPVRFVLSVP
ncbi:MAG: hypothetical protein A3H96_17275 [Acidobacteria bacterium RIFCSPLOWO2_02_FULL_67_36]|nr:MAG: hypothetical protein A3H96_17275 [Acidobacteria bacterium RIFCSPLOWO2_02_FULL_67_36]OFW25767.1 MAG: hypothetical protein A3G21_25160 [Acidobacteria bacterium RIFCSPLOWO2_12_FULL_66_21]